MKNRLASKICFKKEDKIYRKLERDLSEDNIEHQEQDVGIFEKTRSQTIEPDPSRRYGKQRGTDKMFNNLIKLSNNAVQSHLKKLQFENGAYKLNQSDSSK